MQSIVLLIIFVMVIAITCESSLVSVCASQVQQYPSKPIISLCLADYHGCAVFDTKEIKCWGSRLMWGDSVSFIDSIGHNITDLGNNLPFINFGKNVKIEQVSCASSHTCVRLDSGYMKCLGSNIDGKIGIGISETSISVIGKVSNIIGDDLPSINIGIGLKVIAIALGSDHSCALLSNHKVKCYGKNYFGQLGLGNTANIGSSLSQMGENLPFIDFGKDFQVESVHSGSSSRHSCVIFMNPSPFIQRIKCWGHSGYNQLGYESTNYVGDEQEEMGDKLPLIDFGIESRVQQLSLSQTHTCALLINRDVKCFGQGILRNHKTGLSSITLLPYESISTSGIKYTSPIYNSYNDANNIVRMISTGLSHTCILFDDQLTLKCFGDNSTGQLGQGDELDRGTATVAMLSLIPAIDLGRDQTKIISIHSGYYFNCVVFEDHKVKCFGWNYYGQLAIDSLMRKVGTKPNEMGTRLQYAMLFSPTKKPTRFAKQVVRVK